MKKILFFLLFFFILPNLYSQKDKATKAFDRLLYNISINIASSNPAKAMHLTDSLYNYSTTEKQRLESLIVMANIKEKQEKHDQAIKLIHNALPIAEQENDYSALARIYGFLSEQYRIIGFFDRAKELTEMQLAISSKIEDKDEVNRFRAMFNKERAEYSMDKKEYEIAIEYLNLAILYYEREKNARYRYFLISISEEMLGRAHMSINNNRKSLEHFSKANAHINKAKAGNSFHAALIYQGYAEVLLKINSIDSAQVYLKKALKIVENGTHGTLKQNVYKSNADYYKQRNELDSFSKYDAKFYAILKENEASKKEMVNEAHKLIQTYSKTDSEKKKPYILISIILLLVIVLIIYLKRNSWFIKHKNIPAFNGNKATNLTPRVKTQNEILKKLLEFEASNDFLNKDMSISVLTGQLNTNTKYLRQILKKYKNKNYNTYINDLRINFIVNKLKSDPEYLNYKISYLANESGFSSHSKFTAEFRRAVLICPSEFINGIKK